MTANDATNPNDATDSPESKTVAVVAEKDGVGAQVETIHTNERVPGHPGYYEKDGLRTYGDDVDHDHEPPVWPRRCSHTLDT
jgi:hypothetical protein